METLLDRARQAGMAVMLDACIGRERFHSIVGSAATLERFAQLCETPAVDREIAKRSRAGRRCASAGTCRPCRLRSAGRSAR